MLTWAETPKNWQTCLEKCWSRPSDTFPLLLTFSIDWTLPSKTCLLSYIPLFILYQQYCVQFSDLPKESQIVLGLQRAGLWKEAEADKWELLFSRSSVSEPDYFSDCEGGTYTRKETFWRNSVWNNKRNKLAVKKKYNSCSISGKKIELAVWLTWLSRQGEPRKLFVCWIGSLGFNIFFVLVIS